VNPPILRPAAAADVEEAWRWHESRREGLGDEFLGLLVRPSRSFAPFLNRVPSFTAMFAVDC
jgi:hypothetical protein